MLVNIKTSSGFNTALGKSFLLSSVGDDREMRGNCVGFCGNCVGIAWISVGDAWVSVGVVWKWKSIEWSMDWSCAISCWRLDLVAEQVSPQLQTLPTAETFYGNHSLYMALLVARKKNSTILAYDGQLLQFCDSMCAIVHIYILKSVADALFLVSWNLGTFKTIIKNECQRWCYGYAIYARCVPWANLPNGTL